MFIFSVIARYSFLVIFFLQVLLIYNKMDNLLILLISHFQSICNDDINGLSLLKIISKKSIFFFWFS